MSLFSDVLERLTTEQQSGVVNFTFEQVGDTIIVTEWMFAGSKLLQSMSFEHKIVACPDGTLITDSGFHITSLDDFDDWFVYVFFML